VIIPSDGENYSIVIYSAKDWKKCEQYEPKEKKEKNKEQNETE
jgi:hypothetical protein